MGQQIDPVLILCVFAVGLLIGRGARLFSRAERVFIPLGFLTYMRVGAVSFLEIGQFSRLRVGRSIIWKRA